MVGVCAASNHLPDVDRSEMSLGRILVVDQLERDILAWRRVEINDDDFCHILSKTHIAFHNAPHDEDEL